MRTIIAGSRTIRSLDLVREATYQALFRWRIPISEVVSGTAYGVDKLGETVAQSLQVPVKKFPAPWDMHGKMAGPIRNREMADYADALIAVWDGQSRGTEHMIKCMEKHGKPVFIFHVEREHPRSHAGGW